MAEILVELGATELVELGKSRFLGQASRQSPVLEIFRMVDFLEDPFQGALDPGEKITPQQAAVAQRLRTLSRLERRALLKPESTLQGFSHSEIMAESMRLSAVLDGLYTGGTISLDETELGKSLKKKLKSVGKKVMKVVKSPVFLSVVGLAANLIPGVGQVASAALMTAAAARAKKEQAKKEKKEFKKAQRAASAMEAQQIEEYYKQNEAVFTFYGYTPTVWASLTQDQKRKVIDQAGAGTLEPVIPKDQAAQIVATNPQANQEVVQAAALSTAVQQTYGGQVQGGGVDVSQLPPTVQRQVASSASEYQREIEASGKDNFLAAAMKSVGQGGALDALVSGLGLELPGGAGDVLDKVKGGLPDAFKAGVQDVTNDAAAQGAAGAVSTAIDRGTPSAFPWVPVLIGVGTIGGVAVVLAVKSA